VKSTMMNVPLSLNHLLERAGHLFHGNEIVSRLPDKSLRRHTYGEYYRRTRALASALQGLGLQKGDRVATLCWNHHAHLECYFGIPAAGGVMHTLNLRLSPEEIGWIAGDARPLPGDRRRAAAAVPQFAHLHRLRESARVSVLRRAGARRVHRLRGPAGRRRPRRLRLRAARRERPDRPCATPRAPPAGPRAWCIRTAPPCCTRWSAPGRRLGPARHRRGDAGHAHVPRQQLGHALWRRDGGRQAGVPRPAPAPGRPAGPDAAAAAHAGAGRAHHLDEPDPGLRPRAGGPNSPHHGRWKLPARHAQPGGRRGRAGGADPRLRPARHLDHAGLGHDRDLARGTISYPRPSCAAPPMDERYRRAAMAGVPVPLVDLRMRGEDGPTSPGTARAWANCRCAGPSSPAATTRFR
jgi:fatty-acyl-CoA synthase